MSDPIDRQAAIDALERTKEKDPKGDIASFYNTITDNKIAVVEALPSAQPEIIRCRDCKHFEYDHPYVIQGVPVLGHLVCNRWGDGCKTDEDGFCFMAERREDG